MYFESDRDWMLSKENAQRGAIVVHHVDQTKTTSKGMTASEARLAMGEVSAALSKGDPVVLWLGGVDGEYRLVMIPASQVETVVFHFLEGE